MITCRLVQVLGVAGRERHFAPVDPSHLRLRWVPRVVRIGEAHPAEPVLVGIERIEPGDRPVGHPVGVVDPAVDRVDLDLGRPRVTTASALTCSESSMARQYMPRASGWLALSHCEDLSAPHCQPAPGPAGPIICWRNQKNTAVVYASLINQIGGVIVSVTMIFFPLVLSPFIVLCLMVLFAGKPTE